LPSSGARAPRTTGVLTVCREPKARKADQRHRPCAGLRDGRRGGRLVIFAENVFYQFRSGRIEEVWSVIDKAAIEAQL
jgi:SnoaL-like polyketide cyclase